MPALLLFLASLAAPTAVFSHFSSGTSTSALLSGNRIYVDSAAVGANDGSSWPDAFVDLHDALAVATSGDTIWIAKGTYFPTASTDRMASFVLDKGLSLLGGFAGVETEAIQRDWEQNETILSGDIGVLWETNDNSYHLFRGQGVDDWIVFDGFRIVQGQIDASTPADERAGTAFRLENCNRLALRNVAFTNHAVEVDQEGGVVYLSEADSLVVENCFFKNNLAPAANAGLLLEGVQYCGINQTSFRLNEGKLIEAGGAQEVWLHRLTLRQNEAEEGLVRFDLAEGGSFRCRNSQARENYYGGNEVVGAIVQVNTPAGVPTLPQPIDIRYEQCLFVDNLSADANAPSILQHGNHGRQLDVRVVNSLFWNNDLRAYRAEESVGDENVCLPLPDSRVYLSNSVFASAEPLYLSLPGSLCPDLNCPKVQYAHCRIGQADCPELPVVFELPCQGTAQLACTNSILGEDPLFRDPANGDYRLLPCSPLIDAGANDSLPGDLAEDYSGFQRVYKDVVDIGPLEYRGDAAELLPIPDQAGQSLTADRAYCDLDGWTHFYNCDEMRLLFSVRNLGNFLGNLNGGLTVEHSLTSTYGQEALDLSSADYLLLPDCGEWHVMNRYWSVAGAVQFAGPLRIRSYFREQDFAEVQAATGIANKEELLAYGVTQAAAIDPIVLGLGGEYHDWENGSEASSTEWVLGSQADYFYAEYFVFGLNGSGSFGARVDYDFSETIDTSICTGQVFELGGEEYAASGVYLDTLTTAEGCPQEVQLDLAVHEFTLVSSAILPDNGLLTGAIELEIETNSPDVLFNWSTGATTEDLSNLSAGSYAVTVTYGEDCVEEYTFLVPAGPLYELPNAFSPDGDGNNDVFRPLFPEGAPIEVLSLQIFSRWGELVYEGAGADAAWDGRYKGQPAAADVYLCRLVLQLQGEQLIIHGEVSLLL